jgi:predicted CopG family antitoxin
MGNTTIPIDSDVRDNLRAAKVGNETYSDVITRLLEGDGNE